MDCDQRQRRYPASLPPLPGHNRYDLHRAVRSYLDLLVRSARPPVAVDRCTRCVRFLSAARVCEVLIEASTPVLVRLSINAECPTPIRFGRAAKSGTSTTLTGPPPVSP